MTNTSQLIDREARVAAHNYHPVPVVVACAQGVWVWDVEGRRYLDFMSAYSAVSHGHRHPRLVAALQRQLGRVAITSRAYHSDTLAPFLEKLCAVTGLDRALPMNTGAEAVETAIKAARRHGNRVLSIADGQAEILVARNNFHGRTTTIVGFSSDADYRDGFGPFTPGFRFFDFGDMASLEAARTPNTCAVLVEPIQGEAGIVVPPRGWLTALRGWCDRHRILLILDEVQSGLGRTGRDFAFQHEGIRPDGLILGKALGGGLLPVSALVGTRALMDVFTPGSHGSTFGGNALAAAVGLEALNVLHDEQLSARSAVLGDWMLHRLRALAARHPRLIREVRGRGLWAGVEIDPAAASARTVVERLAAADVLSKETHETVIRFAPPLTITRAVLDWGLDRFEQVLRAIDASAGVHAGADTSTDAGADAGPRPGAAFAGAGAEAGASPARPVLMMSAPDHFEVSYQINPWMDPGAWLADGPRLRDAARAQWQALRDTYRSLGAVCEVQDAVRGLPDMVFTANSGVALDGKVLLARFVHPQRAAEEPHDRAFFESLRARGLIDELHEMPQGMMFEGAGDAIWDVSRQLMWMGWGKRSDFDARDVVRQVFGVRTLSLELIDPRFYHLDTCFCVLSGGEVIWYPAAFSPASRDLVRAVVGDRLIEAGDDDATHLGVNSVCLGRDVVMGYCSPPLRERLTALGYRVHVTPLPTFNRSGGAAYCLTLRLDRRSAVSAPGEAGVGLLTVPG